MESIGDKIRTKYMDSYNFSLNSAIIKNMAITKKSKYKFAVKEHADGTPFIAMEPMLENITPSAMFISFDLPPGTNIRRAEEIAGFLNDNLNQLSLTEF